MAPISLPIYSESYRPSSSWAQLLADKSNSLKSLEPLSLALKTRIQAYLLVEQVRHNLLLSDISLDATKLEALINTPEHTNLTETEQLAVSFAQAVRRIDSHIDNRSDSPRSDYLTVELLQELHLLSQAGISNDGGQWRTGAGKSLAPNHKPTDTDILFPLLENALEWFQAESFFELHPMEQAWLVHLRLMELQPFDRANGRVVRLATSLYAQRAGYLPIIIRAEDRPVYDYALTNGLQMITQPGVELMANAVMRTYDEIITLIKTEVEEQKL